MTNNIYFSVTAELDFPSAPVSVTFAPDQTVAMVCIQIFDDSAVEGKETFTVTLSANDLHVTSDGEITVNIIDNDGIFNKCFILGFKCQYHCSVNQVFSFYLHCG